MQNRFCQEAADLTLHHKRSQPDKPFGGVTVVFGGDFRQILPVIKKGSREDIVSHCILRSKIWGYIKVLHLKHNKRLENSSEQDQNFATWLLNVGNGKHPITDHNNSKIQLNATMKCDENTTTSLISAIYPGLGTIDPNANQDDWFLK